MEDLPLVDTWVMRGASPSTLHSQPPAASSLLFGVLDNTGRIRELKNDNYPGSFRMELEGGDTSIGL